MKKTVTRIRDLAALNALGALDGEDATAWCALLAADPTARAEAKSLAEITESLAHSLPAVVPAPSLKTKILAVAERAKARGKAQAEIKKLVPTSQDGLAFLREAGGSGWLPLPVAGAFVKLLSMDDASGYAVVLGKLEAGSRYPAHTHKHPEDIFMLSGDLHVGEHLIRAGDFHHADASSRHGVNWSEEGCVLLCVISKEDLLAQLAP